MKVTDDMIDHLSHLARLKFNETEKASLKIEMEKMIAFVEKLDEADTTGVEPLLHISERMNVLRDDKVNGSVSRDEALLNAPLKDRVYFKVPKVIKK